MYNLLNVIYTYGRKVNFPENEAHPRSERKSASVRGVKEVRTDGSGRGLTSRTNKDLLLDMAANDALKERELPVGVFPALGPMPGPFLRHRGPLLTVYLVFFHHRTRSNKNFNIHLMQDESD